jgi:hypothetical protein
MTNPDKRQILLHHFKSEHPCSEALFRFTKRHKQVFDLFFFSVHLTAFADRSKAIAKGVLDGKHVEEVEAEFDFETGTMFKQLKEFSNLQSENMCIRLVDNFLCYLSEVIQTVMLKRPELLRSGETIKIEEVLRFSSYKDLVSYLADKKINDLSYGGIKGIAAFLDERTGCALTVGDEEWKLLTVAIELRNIYTHNRGVVNDLFLKRLRSVDHGLKIERGKRFHAEFDLLASLANNLFDIATRLDREIGRKFRTKVRKYRVWNGEPKTGEKTKLTSRIKEADTSESTA